ncbi:hypothetical protein N9933_01195 [bacterium]|nr:hypothetical protein [bacterium]
MVVFNILALNIAADTISVDITTSATNTFLTAVLYNKNTFEDPLLAIDLSAKLVGTGINESFNITASDAGVSQFNGIYYLVVTTSEIVVPQDNCTIDTNKGVGYVANLTVYKECVLNKTLSMCIDDCKIVVGNCTECTYDPLLVDTLIEGVYYALEEGYLHEANTTLCLLDEICNICDTCPSYGNTTIVDSIHIVSNNIVRYGNG